MSTECESVGGSATKEGENSIKGEPVHGSRYIQYNVHGDVFELPDRYAPPIRPIGRGAYGFVCAAFDSVINREVAIKRIGNAFNNRVNAQRTLREIKILCHLDHENVIPIIDVIRPRNKETFKDVYIVCELMHFDLHQLLRSKQPLTDQHYQYFMYQILRGLKYIHSANVLHRDLKPTNLLINADCDLKIADFGLARIASERVFMIEYVVTRWYRAPELLLGFENYTTAIDVWSVGCVLAEMVTGQILFRGKDHIDQLTLIIQLLGSPDEASLEFLNSESARKFVKSLPLSPRQDFSARFPTMRPAAVDLLEKLLEFDPHKRITVEEALAHPYFSLLHDVKDEPVCTNRFNFSFESQFSTEEEIKELVWRESVKFNPDPIV